MARAKKFTVKIGDVTWKLEKAELLLNDFNTLGGYNIPVIALEFTQDLELGDRSWQNTLHVGLNFQRGSSASSLSGTPLDWDDRATGFMDTADEWGVSYGGSTELSDSGRFAICDYKFQLCPEDRARIAIVRKIAKAIDTFNLRHVDKDHCAQSVAAIEHLGGYVVKKYAKACGEYLPLMQQRSEGVKLGANAKAISDHRAARDVADCA